MHGNPSDFLSHINWSTFLKIKKNSISRLENEAEIFLSDFKVHCFVKRVIFRTKHDVTAIMIIIINKLHVTIRSFSYCALAYRFIIQGRGGGGRMGLLVFNFFARPKPFNISKFLQCILDYFCIPVRWSIISSKLKHLLHFAYSSLTLSVLFLNETMSSLKNKNVFPRWYL